MKTTGKYILAGLFAMTLFHHNLDAQVKTTAFKNSQYSAYRDSIYAEERRYGYDSNNVFDNDEFIPGRNSFDSLLIRMDEVMKQQLAEKRKKDRTINASDEDTEYNQGSITAYRTATGNKKEPGTCKEIECFLYAEVSKSDQLMTLYLNGELLDTFSVSTGAGGYETPNLNLRPSGPIFIKYSSKKFPGGNYQGLGNMPYAVFLKGGYAVHGTTTGNIPKLGTPASHGCIRLHPDNARIFNELVREVGLENTWVKVMD